MGIEVINARWLEMFLLALHRVRPLHGTESIVHVYTFLSVCNPAKTFSLVSTCIKQIYFDGGQTCFNSERCA